MTNTTTMNNVTVNAAAKNLTFAEAREKFRHTNIIQFFEGEKLWDVGLSVDDIHSTRRSFLLDCDDIDTTFVVSKKSADAFTFRTDTLSEAVLEQLCNDGFDLDDAKFVFCRYWSARSKKYGVCEHDYVFPCKQEQAKHLMMCVPVDSCAKYVDWRAMKERGAVSYNRSEDTDYSIRDGVDIECWIFQYDPETDSVILPPDAIDQKIDRMIELLEQ